MSDINACDTVNLTASGDIKLSRCRMAGFYVNSTTAGTIIFKEGGSGGTALCGTITPAVGWHSFPAEFNDDAYATIGGTLNVTIFFK